MKLLYAAVNKIKVSPAKVMIKQWRDNFKMTGPVECTSLITRICERAGALQNSRITFLDAPRTLLDMQHLVQGHILKHGPRGSIFYIVADGLDDIRLPNQDYSLYTCQELTMQPRRNDAPRASTSARVTRSMSMRMPGPGPEAPEPSRRMPTPPWDLTSSEADFWSSGSEPWNQGQHHSTYEQGAGSGHGHYNYGPDIAQLTGRMETLDVRTTGMEGTLNQLAADSQQRHHTYEQWHQQAEQWQTQTGQQIGRMSVDMARGYEHSMAFYRSFGYEPDEE